MPQTEFHRVESLMSRELFKRVERDAATAGESVSVHIGRIVSRSKRLPFDPPKVGWKKGRPRGNPK